MIRASTWTHMPGVQRSSESFARKYSPSKFHTSLQMGVSHPKSSIFNRVFHGKNHPFWVFFPYFWKHPDISWRFFPSKKKTPPPLWHLWWSRFQKWLLWQVLHLFQPLAKKKNQRVNELHRFLMCEMVKKVAKKKGNCHPNPLKFGILTNGYISTPTDLGWWSWVI